MSTLHPVAHHPPTNNTMDPDQRSRLLRTARKLEAVLGTTPQVMESNDHRLRPSAKARRRNIVYGSQFSSSASSLESTSSEKEYVSVKSKTLSASSGSPSSKSSHSASPTCDKVLVTTDEKQKKRTKGGPQPLAQPILLRMSAVPADKHHRQSSISNTSAGTAVPPMPARPANPAPAPAHVTVTPAAPLVTPFERRKFKVDSVLGPLSPINKSHFPAHLHSETKDDLDLQLSPSSPAEAESFPPAGLSDREKRIKMAKLQRMMGENIPPELVFREATQPAVEKSEKKLRRKSRSMSAMRATAFSSIPEEPKETKCKGKVEEITQPLRPLPNASIITKSSRPRPAPIVTQTKSTTSSSPLVRQPSSSMQQKGRKSRPRSLTLGDNSAFVVANRKLAQQERQASATAARTRGTVSLDEDRYSRRHRKKSNGVDNDKTQGPIVERSDPAPFIQPRRKGSPSNFAVFKSEIWRRKEREWSGEWNIPDMEEVTKALRGLKAS